MDGFSEKSIHALGEYYVYGLVDPRTKKFFYIGKGSKNRVFEHERESIGKSNDDKLRLKKISEIRNAGLEVEKVIIHFNLSEKEAFAAEASLISAYKYNSNESLTNIVSGHHSSRAMTVEEFEQEKGAILLEEKDIRHKILVIKINKLYQRGMDERELYDIVRGAWRISKKNLDSIEYVFGVYNSLIVAVYKPTAWYVCNEVEKSKLPREDIPPTNRLFFEDERFENGLLLDENAMFYVGKSIANLKDNQKAHNPITYLNPKNKI